MLKKRPIYKCCFEFFFAHSIVFLISKKTNGFLKKNVWLRLSLTIDSNHQRFLLFSLIEFYQVENDEPPQTTIQSPENYNEFEDENVIGVSNSLAKYSISRSDKGDGTPIYDSTLGLAVETLPDGFTLSSLWEVIPTTNLSAE